ASRPLPTHTTSKSSAKTAAKTSRTSSSSSAYSTRGFPAGMTGGGRSVEYADEDAATVRTLPGEGPDIQGTQSVSPGRRAGPSEDRTPHDASTASRSRLARSAD